LFLWIFFDFVLFSARMMVPADLSIWIGLSFDFSDAYAGFGTAPAIGPMAVAVGRERTYKENERNLPAAAVSVWKGGTRVGSGEPGGRLRPAGGFSSWRQALSNRAAARTLV
jgi:hypothetical protein